jgi:hypothetical protein
VCAGEKARFNAHALDHHFHTSQNRDGVAKIGCDRAESPLFGEQPMGAEIAFLRLEIPLIQRNFRCTGSNWQFR